MLDIKIFWKILGLTRAPRHVNTAFPHSQIRFQPPPPPQRNTFNSIPKIGNALTIIQAYYLYSLKW